MHQVAFLPVACLPKHEGHANQIVDYEEKLYNVNNIFFSVREYPLVLRPQTGIFSENLELVSHVVNRIQALADKFSWWRELVFSLGIEIPNLLDQLEEFLFVKDWSPIWGLNLAVAEVEVAKSVEMD